MNTVCSKMWTDLNIDVPRKLIRHCCKKKLKPLSKEDLLLLGKDAFQDNDNIYNDRKYTIETGKDPAGCQGCEYKVIWNKWEDHMPDENLLLLENDKVEMIELTISAVCNMSCMYCQPNVSTEWNRILSVPYEEDDEYKQLLLKNLYEYIEKYQVNKPTPLRYNFMGGEPLLNLEVYDVIDKFIELHSKNPKKQVTIGLVTNLNVKSILIKRLIKIANDSKNIIWHIRPSIDALGEIGEIQRDGLNFKLWEENIKLLIDSPFFIKIIPTVTSLSLQSLPELIEYLFDLFKNRSYGASGTKWTIAENYVDYTGGPKALSLNVLPDSYKKYIKESSEVFKRHVGDNNSFLKYLDMLHDVIGKNRTEDDIKACKDFFKKHSEIKNKDYIKIFPAIKDIIS